MIEAFFNFFSNTLEWGDYVPHRWFILFISSFFMILFLQSGIDKILSFSGNMSYFRDHFKNTFFKNQIKFLLVFITFLELVSGGLCLYVFIANFTIGEGVALFLMPYYCMSLFLVLLTILCLFFGQRIAKDYAGAVNLGIYFLIALIGLSLPVLFLEL